MLQYAVLTAFCAMIAACAAAGLSIAWALAAGWLLFAGFAKRLGFSWSEIREQSLSGVRTVSGILITFLFIGALTASWRACGTIADIVTVLTGFIRPEAALVFVFLANALLSVLTGTSFGTMATMGVISMAIGSALGIDPAMTGGAVMSGIYVGDRWSPLSTSAMLVAAVTGTKLRDNLARMLPTGTIALLVSAALYLGLSLASPGSGTVPDAAGLFSRVYASHPVTFLPAAIVVILVLLRRSVRETLFWSTAAAAAICVFLQGTEPLKVAEFLVLGFSTPDPAVGPLMNGGGMVSFAQGILIVCISSSYAGIFRATRLLDSLQKPLARLAQKASVFSAVLAAALVSSAVSCNQSFACMLTADLCREIRPDGGRLAASLEDSAIVIPGAIPWSIASAIPIATIGAPVSCLFFAFFLYAVPLSRLVLDRERLKPLAARQ